jgi:4'-phosphopantetheinyl transferase
MQRAPELKFDQVHIWSAYLPDNKKNTFCFASILSREEYQRANNYIFPNDREDFIVSRGILRCLLGKYLGQDPRKVEIAYGLWGKPCLVNQYLYFNLSHSKDYILYALTSHYEVGIDLEYINEAFGIEDIILRILSPHELRHWKNIKSEEKTNLFFKLWACKEAFLKASGKGWLHNNQKISLEILDFLKNDSKTFKATEKMIMPYSFEYIPRYASALFIEGPFLHPLYYSY